jgi:hypothetical protein
VPVALALRVPATNGALVVWLAMAGYGLLQTYYGLVYAGLHDVVGPEMRGIAMSVYLMVTYLCGASFGPLLTGRLSDVFARAAAGGGTVSESARAIGLHQAMWVIPVLSVILAGVLWMGGRTRKALR